MRKTGLVAAGLALTLALVGCGTKQAGTPSAAGDASSGGSGVTPKVFGNALDLAGAVNNNSKAKQSAKLAIEATGAMSMKGDGAFRVNGTDVAMKMSLDMGASVGKMEMVIVDKAFYMKIPTQLAGQSGLSADKPWIKISADGTDPLSKTLAPLLENMGQSFDVSKTMDQIKNAGEITKSAKEPLDGQDTTHYWVKIDMLKAAQMQADPQLKKAAEDAVAKSGVKSMDMEIWVNTDNLPVQIAMATPVMQGQTMNMTMKYLDWGQPVDIAAPPADQIGEMPH
jgi:hypothetical protein